MTLKQKKYESIKTALKNIEPKVFEIFKDLTNSDSDYSVYNLKIIENKLEDLKDEVKKNNNILKKFNILSINIWPLLNLNTLFILFIFFINIKVATIALIINLIFKIYVNLNYVFDNNPLTDKSLNEICTEINNCYIFLDKRKLNLEQQLKITHSEMIKNNAIFEVEEKRYNIANLIINAYIVYPNPLEKLLDYPKEIQNMIISILQKDLKSDETDIIKLFTIARESLEPQSLLKYIPKKKKFSSQK